MWCEASNQWIYRQLKQTLSKISLAEGRVEQQQSNLEINNQQLPKLNTCTHQTRQPSAINSSTVQCKYITRRRCCEIWSLKRGRMRGIGSIALLKNSAIALDSKGVLTTTYRVYEIIKHIWWYFLRTATWMVNPEHLSIIYQ